MKGGTKCLKETEWDRQTVAREKVQVRDEVDRVRVAIRVAAADKEAAEEPGADQAEIVYAHHVMKRCLMLLVNVVQFKSAPSAVLEWLVNFSKGSSESCK